MRPSPRRRNPVGHVEWRTATEIKVKFRNLPLRASTKDLWDLFSKEGELSAIELYVDREGERDGAGCLRFSPPPERPFWQLSHGWYEIELSNPPTVTRLRLELTDPREDMYRATPGGRPYHQKLWVKANSLQFGFFSKPRQMKVMLRCQTIPAISIVVEQDLKFREIAITFPLRVSADRCYHYRLALRHANHKEIWQIMTPGFSDGNRQSLVIALKDVPEFGVKYDDGTSHTPGARTWSRRHAWAQITDILYGGEHVTSKPLCLRKEDSIVDLGRWRVYRLDFDLGIPSVRKAFTTFCQALEDFNAVINRQSDFCFDNQKYELIWDYIDGSGNDAQPFSSSLAELQSQSTVVLPFAVRYMLETCFSENLLNEYVLSRDSLHHLEKIGEPKALALLEGLANDAKPVYDYGGLCTALVSKSRRSSRIPSHCAYIRTALVTPTTVYYYPPTIEISNRVIRQYALHSDRFLRVRFGDERHIGKLYPRKLYANGKSSRENLYRRIRHIMTAGIDVGSRHYDFLAFGNSQFRENGAYFFASTDQVTVQSIREWMGDFHHIRSISKYAARLGQCFSTTRAIRSAKAELVEIPDIKSHDGKYNFTDGVGRISKSLAQMAADEMGIIGPDNEVPSILQFRLGGSKGVLAVHHDPRMRIYIRESQYKFPAQYEGLEIIKWSQISAAHLNRQLIAVLSTLGVPDEVFLTKAKEQIANLETAMTSEKVALACLQREVDPNQITLAIASLVRDGFQETQEPFVTNLLHLWRAHSTKYLKEKAKMPIRKGACLLGCVDEAGVLRGYYDRDHVGSSKDTHNPETSQVAEIFVQLSKGETGSSEVITGTMLLARNPSLHPGDVRVVRGVDNTALRHLKDTVVLPQSGDRDLASMCSGGDLDGDEFVVIWDQTLIPKEWNAEPMDYTAPPELRKDDDVTIKDVIDFFVTYMSSNTLGNIANSHVAIADKSPDGVKDTKCIQLAMLHSKAVDYAKSGQPAQMEAELWPKEYPHFMAIDSSNKKTYHSRTALGQLFDLVEPVKFTPLYYKGFDERILRKYDLDSSTIQKANELKTEYDRAMRRVMTQYDIATDLEVWSTFVIKHDKAFGDYKLHEVIGQHAASIKDTYRKRCYEAAGSRNFDCIGPFVAAMYTVTADEVRNSLELEEGLIEAEKTLAGVMISFPWLFPRILGQLANNVIPPQPLVHNKPLQQTPAGFSTSKEPLQLPTRTGKADILETGQGETHLGDELILFEDSKVNTIQPQEQVIGVDRHHYIDKDAVVALQLSSSTSTSLLDDESDSLSTPALMKLHQDKTSSALKACDGRDGPLARGDAAQVSGSQSPASTDPVDTPESLDVECYEVAIQSALPSRTVSSLLDQLAGL